MSRDRNYIIPKKYFTGYQCPNCLSKYFDRVDDTEKYVCKICGGVGSLNDYKTYRVWFEDDLPADQQEELLKARKLPVDRQCDVGASAPS